MSRTPVLKTVFVWIIIVYIIWFARLWINLLEQSFGQRQESNDRKLEAKRTGVDFFTIILRSDRLRGKGSRI